MEPYIRLSGIWRRCPSFPFWLLVRRACVGTQICVGAGRSNTFKDADGGGEVVDPSCGLQRCDDDGGGGDEVVGEGVVEVALRGRISDLLGVSTVG